MTFKFLTFSKLQFPTHDIRAQYQVSLICLTAPTVYGLTFVSDFYYYLGGGVLNAPDLQEEFSTGLVLS